ncbi:hypothetical protein JIN84_14930 [Luteolibacter yonseiensis]|uniref:Trimeric autotransporter adhesin YadA-like head domain-containing protein n=1 Tax=Luteolibacter yonseiensis TaxID=1144680 RepID=A0A934R200_9BACT|nr:hypothetical protein [Luteolibacter yonseiensis]MBK1816918.1 hypothetical protein [Luteolibacter yonseiensis]
MKTTSHNPFLSAAISLTISLLISGPAMVRAAATLNSSDVFVVTGSPDGNVILPGNVSLAGGIDIGATTYSALQIDYYGGSSHTAVFGTSEASNDFVWKDNLAATPRNKMWLNDNNVLTLYKADGNTSGFSFEPDSGIITLPATGGSIRSGSTTAMSISGLGALSFSVAPSFTGGLLIPSGQLNVTATTASTSSGTGALIVAGGIGVLKDSFINGVRIGKGAGTGNGTNTALGVDALLSNTTGFSNTGLGASALRLNQGGYNNSGVGVNALTANTSGANNTALGSYALYANSSGYYNTSTGVSALQSNTTGGSNSAFGDHALYLNTTAHGNSAFGKDALYSNLAYYNSAMGYRALYLNTSGSGNSATGGFALAANTTGSNNSATGSYALFSNTVGSSNTATGANAMYANTNGADNTASGAIALYSNVNGSYNVSTGWGSLYSNISGNYNTVVGYRAAYSNTTGSQNTAVGSSAGTNNTTGRQNVFLGINAGASQADGSAPLADPFNSVYIGFNTRGGNDDDDNSIVIGANAIGEGANTTVLGNATTEKSHLFGQTTLTNTPWKTRDPLVPAVEDPTTSPDDNGGEALVVEGHAVLAGKVTLSVPQGDILMGEFGN